MDIHIEPSDSVIGAAVTGVGIGEPPSGDCIELIEDALEQYGVLVFPGQDITPAQQVAFSAAFGPLELTELERARLPGHEEIFVVGNVGKGLVSFAPDDPAGELEWHTDHIHHEVPARASLLYALEVPATGGDTLFACMYHAYESLDPGTRSQCDALTAIHSASGLEHYLAKQELQDSLGSAYGRDHKRVAWPLVRRHPRNGRRALYFGNQVTVGIDGWEDARARAFIHQLAGHACQPAFRYRHRWSAGDAVLWDNRRVLHAGTPYDVENSRRCMHRTTWRETEPVAGPIPGRG